MFDFPQYMIIRSFLKLLIPIQILFSTKHGQPVNLRDFKHLVMSLQSRTPVFNWANNIRRKILIMEFFSRFGLRDF
jgi:hypothetical protein